MKVAKAKGRLRGKAPKLSAAQETHLVGLYRAGQHTTAELAELFSVGRSTVYRANPTRWRTEGGTIEAVSLDGLGLVTAPLPAPLLHGRRWLRRGTCPGGRTVATGC
jgi:hypothetical protein